MLPAAHRLTDGRSFRSAVRDGRRVGSRTLVVHLAPGEGASAEPPRVGLVVGRSVGNSVVRHRVLRRLRHLVREQLGVLPASTLLVVRANPAAATAPARELGSDLARCLQRVMS